MAALRSTSLLLVFALAPCFADVVYNQTATFPGGIASQQCAPCFGNIEIDFTAYDDFTLNASQTIQTVLWQGAYGTAGNRITDLHSRLLPGRGRIAGYAAAIV